MRQVTFFARQGAHLRWVATAVASIAACLSLSVNIAVAELQPCRLFVKNNFMQDSFFAEVFAGRKAEDIMVERLKSKNYDPSLLELNREKPQEFDFNYDQSEFVLDIKLMVPRPNSYYSNKDASLSLILHRRSISPSGTLSIIPVFERKSQGTINCTRWRGLLSQFKFADDDESTRRVMLTSPTIGSYSAIWDWIFRCDSEGRDMRQFAIRRAGKIFLQWLDEIPACSSQVK